MKPIFTLTILLLVSSGVFGNNDPDDSAIKPSGSGKLKYEYVIEMSQQRAKCLDEMNLTAEELTELTIDNNPKLECADACALKKIGMIKKNVFVRSKVLEFERARNVIPMSASVLDEKVLSCVDRANKKQHECAKGGVYVRCIELIRLLKTKSGKS